MNQEHTKNRFIGDNKLLFESARGQSKPFNLSINCSAVQKIQGLWSTSRLHTKHIKCMHMLQICIHVNNRAAIQSRHQSSGKSSFLTQRKDKNLLWRETFTSRAKSFSKWPRNLSALLNITDIFTRLHIQSESGAKQGRYGELFCQLACRYTLRFNNQGHIIVLLMSFYSLFDNRLQPV